MSKRRIIIKCKQESSYSLFVTISLHIIQSYCGARKSKKCVFIFMQVSLKSVEWSNSICEKIIYFYNNHGKGVSNGFSAEVAKDIFAVLSSAIFSARFVADGYFY